MCSMVIHLHENNMMEHLLLVCLHEIPGEPPKTDPFQLLSIIMHSTISFLNVLIFDWVMSLFSWNGSPFSGSLGIWYIHTGCARIWDSSLRLFDVLNYWIHICGGVLIHVYYSQYRTFFVSTNLYYTYMTCVCV